MTSAGSTYIDSHGSKTYLRTGAGGTQGAASNYALTFDNSNGNIGIGTTNPLAYFHVVGQGTGTNCLLRAWNNTGNDQFYIREDGVGYLKAAAWNYGSDLRLKENIKYIDTGLERVLRLKPAKFDYITGAKDQLGFIAQDVQSVIPEAVSVSDEKTGYLGLKSEFIIPYLVNGMKEQQKQIEELKAKIAVLEKK
jgi:hypothetical protein